VRKHGVERRRGHGAVSALRSLISVVGMEV
jgi:hypothetical protein